MNPTTISIMTGRVHESAVRALSGLATKHRFPLPPGIIDAVRNAWHRSALADRMVVESVLTHALQAQRKDHATAWLLGDATAGNHTELLRVAAEKRAELETVLSDLNCNVTDDLYVSLVRRKRTSQLLLTAVTFAGFVTGWIFCHVFNG